MSRYHVAKFHFCKIAMKLPLKFHENIELNFRIFQLRFQLKFRLKFRLPIANLEFMEINSAFGKCRLLSYHKLVLKLLGP